MKKHTKSLQIISLSVHIGEKKILHDISLEVAKGTIHVIMGPNGSGKSTLANALMGHPSCVISSRSKIIMDGVNITKIETDQRARKGLFLGFQSPVAVSGVSIMNLLRSVYMFSSHPFDKKISTVSKRKTNDHVGIADHVRSIKETAEKLAIPETLLFRGINDGFSGGEKKKMEILTAMVLNPKYIVFDEIDTGLDVDALRIVARSIKKLAENGSGVIVITHYQRLLKYLKPDYVHILVDGAVKQSGKISLARLIEKKGYKGFAS